MKAYKKTLLIIATALLPIAVSAYSEAEKRVEYDKMRMECNRLYGESQISYGGMQRIENQRLDCLEKVRQLESQNTGGTNE